MLLEHGTVMLTVSPGSLSCHYVESNIVRPDYGSDWIQNSYCVAHLSQIHLKAFNDNIEYATKKILR